MQGFRFYVFNPANILNHFGKPASVPGGIGRDCAFLCFRGVSSNDFASLETLCKKIIKEKQAFERLEVKKETLLEMFKVNLTIHTASTF